MALNLGTATGRIRMLYDNSGVNSAVRDLDRLGGSADSVRGNLGKVAAVAGAGAIAIAGAFLYAGNKAIQFEKQISAIGAVSGATKADLELLRKKALQLGADTAFSASEAAMAMEELAKAGVSLPDILNGAADAAVALAAAGGVSLPEAAILASDAMASFALSAADMMDVADLIAGAANASSIDMGQFGLSLKAVGAVAHLVGISFADTATAIALMGKMGIKGSDAGTSLKTMLMNLNPSTKKQTTLMSELGIVTADGSNRFFDAAGNAKGLADISQILQDSLAGQTKQQKLATLETLFGSDAIRAAAILSDQGAAGFNNMADAMGKVSAADVAKTRLDNAAGAIEQLKGSAETLAITFGTLLLPAIKRLAQFLTELANWLNGLDPKWQKMIAFVALAAAGFLALMAVIAGIGLAIMGLGAASGFVTVFAVVALIAAALVGLGFAFKAAWNSSQAFRTMLTTAFEALKGGFQKVVTALTPLINYVRNELMPGLAKAVQTAWQKFQPALVAMTAFIETRVKPAFDKIAAAIQTAMPTIVTIARFIGGVLMMAIQNFGAMLGWLIPKLLNIAGPVFSFLVGAIAMAISSIKTIGQVVSAVFNFIVGVITGVVGFLVSAWNAITPPVIAAFNAVVSAVKTAFGFVSGIVSGVIDFFISAWNAISAPVMAVFNLIVSIIKLAFTIISAVIAVGWAIISAIFSAVYNFLVPPIVSAFNFVVDAIKAAFEFIKSAVSAGWGIITAAFAAVYNTIVPPVKSAFEFVRNIISSVIDFVKPFISSALNAISGFFSSHMNRAKDTTSSVWDSIKSFFQAGVARIVAIADGIRAIVDKISNFFGQLRDAASGGVGSLISFVSGIPGRIFSALGNIGSLLYGAGRDVIQGLLNGISNMAGAVMDKARGIANSVKDTIMGALHIGSPSRVMMEIGGWTGEGLAIGLENSQTKIVRAAELAAMAARNSMAQLPTDFSGSVRTGTLSAAAGIAPSSSSSGQVTTSTNYQIPITVNAPQNMSPNDVGTAVARRVVLGLAGAGASL